MTIVELQNTVITPLTERKSSIDALRIELAYQDLLDMAGLAEALEGVPALSGSASDDAAIVQRTLFTRYLVVILKSLYMLADIYISTLLYELVATPGKRISLMKFLKDTGTFVSLHLGSILGAYCLVVYRNKLITHHDFRRMYSYTLDADGTYRFNPLPMQIQISQQHSEDLNRLRSAYQMDIPKLTTEENRFNQLRLLFYGIPIGKIGAISKDRETIDKIAECGGCPSMTRAEILEATDLFSLAVTQAFN